jgi:5-methylcytosine-specific restriction endonuclease McrA
MSVLVVIIKLMSEIYGLSVIDDQPASSPADPEPTSSEPLEQLERQICELAGHLAAGTCRFLQLVAEFDARRGWASWDLPSCAAWMAWKCQVAPGTAREQVRVARALTSLPVITAEFAAGRMSYAKVRALTRIATSETEAGLAEIVGPMTAAQCERFAAAHRKASNDEELASRAARRVSVHVAEDGSVSISARLPATDGAVVLQALRAATGDCEHQHRPHPDPAEDTGTGAADDPSSPASAPDTSADDVSAETAAAAAPAEADDGAWAGQRGRTCAAGLADALVEVSRAYLSGKIATAGNPDIYQVVVHVGPEALTPGTPRPTPAGVSAETPLTQPEPAASTAGRQCGHPAHPARCHLEDGPAIAPAAAQALACHATVTWMLHDHDGNLLDVGRRHRRATPALRRAVRERDKGRCQFPGCNSRRTDIHHVIPWAKGGKTRLRSLISLCEAHHVIVHALGYLITPAENGTFAFTRPDGKPLPNAPGLPGSDGDLARCHDADITTETIIPIGLADKPDLDLAIWAAFANARIDRENSHQEDLDLAA